MEERQYVEEHNTNLLSRVTLVHLRKTALIRQKQ